MNIKIKIMGQSKKEPKIIKENGHQYTIDYKSRTLHAPMFVLEKYYPKEFLKLWKDKGFTLQLTIV